MAALCAAPHMSIARWSYWDIEGEPLNETLEVALALEHIMKTDMTNPGVLHLHINLVESSLTPERALISADALEPAVSIAGHGVHMPSHIYVRVGRYSRASLSRQLKYWLVTNRPGSIQIQRLRVRENNGR